MALETWKIDPARSSVQFTVRHMVISKVRGRFARWEARLQLDIHEPATSSVDVTIDAGSIDTGMADRDAYLRSPDSFDVERFPSLTYRSRRVEALPAGRLRVVGDLTIRAVTREVILDVEYGGRGKKPWSDERAGFSARTSLNRKDFGLAWSQALETGGLLVGDKVDVAIELQASRQAAARIA
jgi:polyisoprenoid-binding protein YceI